MNRILFAANFFLNAFVFPFKVPTVPDLWFDLGFFDFTTVQKHNALSRNHASQAGDRQFNPPLWGCAVAARQAPVSYVITRVRDQNTTILNPKAICFTFSTAVNQLHEILCTFFNRLVWGESAHCRLTRECWAGLSWGGWKVRRIACIFSLSWVYWAITLFVSQGRSEFYARMASLRLLWCFESILEKESKEPPTLTKKMMRMVCFSDLSSLEKLIVFNCS